MLVKPIQKPLAKRLAETISHQVIDPDPGESAESDFERAGPIDPALKRVLREPAFQFAFDLREKLLPARKQICLGQQNQVLVPVKLPDIFVVAGSGGVEVRYAAEKYCGSCHSAGVVAPPVDIRASLERHPQHRKAML